MAEIQGYWVRRDGRLGRSIKYGDPVSGLDPDSLAAHKAKGFISDKNPESVTQAEKETIVVMKSANQELLDKINELEIQNDELEKKLDNPQVKSKKVKEKIKGLEERIEELEKQLEEATAPGGE